MAVKDPETWMWERARALVEQADHLHLQVYYRSGRRRPAWVPPADVFETPTEVWIAVSLPGVSAESVELEFDGTSVLISGERRLPAWLLGSNVRRLEIPHGRFERYLELPAACVEILRKQWESGCFFLALRKRSA